VKRIVGYRVRMGDNYGAPRWWGIRMTEKKPKPMSLACARSVAGRLRTIQATFGGGAVRLIRVVRKGGSK